MEAMVASLLAVAALLASPDAGRAGSRHQAGHTGVLGRYTAAELKAVYLRLRQLILASAKVTVDETIAPMLDSGRGSTKQGCFWAVARDDRPRRGIDPPAIAFAPGTARFTGSSCSRAIRHLAVRRLRRLQEDCCHPGGPGRYTRRLQDASAPPVLRQRQGTTRRSRAKRWSGLRRSMQLRRRSAGRRVRQDQSKSLVPSLKIWLKQQLAYVSAKAKIAEEIP